MARICDSHLFIDYHDMECYMSKRGNRIYWKQKWQHDRWRSLVIPPMNVQRAINCAHEIQTNKKNSNNKLFIECLRNNVQFYFSAHCTSWASLDGFSTSAIYFIQSCIVSRDISHWISKPKNRKKIAVKFIDLWMWNDLL